MNHGFLWLWAAHTVSVFGSLLTRTALPFAAILTLGASPLDMALLTITDLGASVATSFVVAPWVDRLRRRRLMLAADVGRAAVLATVPLAAVTGLLRLELLYAVVFVAGSLDTLFELTQAAYVPTLVPRDRLVAANARLSGSASAAEIAAFGVGGWLVQWLGAPHAIAVDAATFVVSACCLARIAHPEPRAQREPAAAPWRDATHGARALARDPLLRGVVLADAAGAFAFRAFSAVFLLFVTRDLGFTPGVLGLVFATGGLSSLAGAVLAPRLGRWVGAPRAVAGGIALTGGALLLVPLARRRDRLRSDPAPGAAAGRRRRLHSRQRARGEPAPDARSGRASRACQRRQAPARHRRHGPGRAGGGVVGQTGGLRSALTLAGGVPLLARARARAEHPAARPRVGCHPRTCVPDDRAYPARHGGTHGVDQTILLFLATNILVMLTISILVQLLGLHSGLRYGIDYGQLMLFCLVWGMAGAHLPRPVAGDGEADDGRAGDRPGYPRPGRAASSRRVRPGARRRPPAMPEVGDYDSPEVNAFATGPTRSRALVAVSTGSSSA